MEKAYYIYAMELSNNGFGIIAVDFILNDPKGKLWKKKPLFQGTFDVCFQEKKKLIKAAAKLAKETTTA